MNKREGTIKQYKEIYGNLKKNNEVADSLRQNMFSLTRSIFNFTTSEKNKIKKAALQSDFDLKSLDTRARSFLASHYGFCDFLGVDNNIFKDDHYVDFKLARDVNMVVRCDRAYIFCPKDKLIDLVEEFNLKINVDDELKKANERIKLLQQIQR